MKDQYLLFSDSELRDFKKLAGSVNARLKSYQGAHDQMPRNMRRSRAYDERAPHVEREVEKEGQGPDRWSIERLIAVVREMYVKPAANAIEQKIRERWPEEMKTTSELEAEHLEEQSAGQEEEEVEEGEDETDTERAEELMQQNRLSPDQQFRKAGHRMPGDRGGRFGGCGRAMDDPPAFSGRPNPGGTMEKLRPEDRINGDRVTGDAARFARAARKFPDAARIASDPRCANSGEATCSPLTRCRGTPTGMPVRKHPLKIAIPASSIASRCCDGTSRP
jgi:hypothetical protein